METNNPPPITKRFRFMEMKFIVTCLVFAICLVLLLPTSSNAREFKTRQLGKRILDAILNSSVYDHRIRPSPLPNNTSPMGETQVDVNLLLRAISKIDDFNMEYYCQVTMRQEWYDDRLAYINNSELRKNISLADFPPYLTIIDTARVWIPDLFFVNEKQAWLHKLIKPNEYIRIYQDGKILFSIRLSLLLGCKMDLHLFPIDRQTCTLVMASYGWTTEDLIFNWKSENPVQMNSLSLPKFHLERMETKKSERETNTGNYSTLTVYFHLRRNFSYYMTQLYIPCIMLVIVSQLSFFIDENAAPARTALGITTLLTMSTQVSSINSRLPPVSYTKIVDIWNGICLIFVFGALLEYAFVNYYVRYDKRTKKQWQEEHGCDPPITGGWLAKHYPSRSKRIDVCSRIIFPLAFLLFNIAYWTYCLMA